MSTNRALHLLVTAGSTREKIDDVREWRNIFTGQTGLDIARAFLDLGNVTLLTSNEAHAREFDGYSGKAGMMGIETFATHAELRDLLEERMTGGGASEGAGGAVDVVAMTAAVSDYKPAGAYRVIGRKSGGDGREMWEVESVSAPKVKSTFDEMAILGERTEKLIDLFRTAWGFRGLLIKFKLEAGITEEELAKVAEASRVASNADLMVANTLQMARPADRSTGSAYLIGNGKPEKIARDLLAIRLTEWVRQRLAVAG